MSFQQADTSLPGWAKALGVVLAVLLFLYAFLIEGALLLWVVPVLGGVTLYLSYRFVVAFERLARAAERLADDRERD